MNGSIKIIVAASLGILVTGLVVVFLLNPALTDISATNANLKIKKADLALLQDQIQAFKSAQKDLTLASRKNDLLTAIVSKENLVIPIKELEAAATVTKTSETLLIQEPGSTTTSFSTNTPPPVYAGVTSIPYQISVSNDFAGMVNFLSYLEHLPHLTQITNFSLTAQFSDVTNSQPVKNGVVSGTLNGVFFIRPAK